MSCSHKSTDNGNNDHILLCIRLHVLAIVGYIMSSGRLVPCSAYSLLTAGVHFLPDVFVPVVDGTYLAEETVVAEFACAAGEIVDCSLPSAS